MKEQITDLKKTFKEEIWEIKTTVRDFIDWADNKYATKEELKTIRQSVDWTNQTKTERVKSWWAIIVALISSLWFIAQSIFTK